LGNITRTSADAAKESPSSLRSKHPKVQTTEQLRIVGVIVRLVFLDPEQSRGEIITPEIKYFPNKNVKGVHPLC
jgi:hypothetical protein